MQARDPDDRAPSITVGVGRAILSNRISHFLNIKGPSMTIDTACSGSLVSADVACRYLQSGEIDGAIVGAANLYLRYVRTKCRYSSLAHLFFPAQSITWTEEQ